MARQQFIQFKYRTEDTIFRIRTAQNPIPGGQQALTIAQLVDSLNELTRYINLLDQAYAPTFLNGLCGVRAQGWLYELRRQVEAWHRKVQGPTMEIAVLRTRSLIDLHKYLLDVDRKLETVPLDKPDPLSMRG